MIRRWCTEVQQKTRTTCVCTKEPNQKWCWEPSTIILVQNISFVDSECLLFDWVRLSSVSHALNWKIRLRRTFVSGTRIRVEYKSFHWSIRLPTWLKVSLWRRKLPQDPYRQKGIFYWVTIWKRSEKKSWRSEHSPKLSYELYWVYVIIPYNVFGWDNLKGSPVVPSVRLRDKTIKNVWGTGGS